MSSSKHPQIVRGQLIQDLKLELMGPSSPDEVINEFPTSRYIVGRLAPARQGESDRDNEVEPTENDTLAIGAVDGEDGEEEANVPLIIGFNPSSIGLSFLVDAKAKSLCARITWGDYQSQEKQGSQGKWKRSHREAVIEGIPISSTGSIPRIRLATTDANPSDVNVSGDEDQEIALEGVVHEFGGYRAVSLFLVNRRTKGALGDRTKDERWIFQPSMTVSSMDGHAVFVAKDHQSGQSLSEEDGEGSVNALLYRHCREFATGHGVAAGWAMPVADGRATTEVFTEFMPHYEVPQLVATSDLTGAATLDMLMLAEVESPDKMVELLEPMVTAYSDWINQLVPASTAPDIQAENLREAAMLNVENCQMCLGRMRDGLGLLQQDRDIFEAFRFANRAMWDQRIHSLWAANNRVRGSVEGSASDLDAPVWRPFQMGFMLLNLRGIADESSADRGLVDLLWFPTGGGKTEAYLGLSAFTMAYRRLRGDRDGMKADAGVSIIMRYTLRLLTVQQFQRAAALICACEIIRRSDPDLWGGEPFRIGIWVGRGTTPNTFEDSRAALDGLKEGKRPSNGSPVQLVSCPRCGTHLVNNRGVPESNTYCADREAQRTLIWCRNGECEFSPINSEQAGLPVVVVDDEIYRTCPALLIATVDKFARMPFKGETRLLFGWRESYSKKYGHLSAAHRGKVGSRKVRDESPAKRLLPPELIIQDELHLISGPLGTMVGLYETAVDACTSLDRHGHERIPAKVIASTATIRRAAQQTRQLFGGRELSVFPPSGLTSRDSFFAREVPIERQPGRLYVGVNAPGSSTKTLLVRVYAILLASLGDELRDDTEAKAADPYGTLVGYFNSMRALGGAKRLVEDDVRLVRMKYLEKQRGMSHRNISEPEELTSRLDSWRIPSLLKKLDGTFPRGKTEWPVDVLLATNMISVGVDIDRLGLMVVTGQPKSTAEYIQATSRVGRKHPGLVVTMYNWLGARDLSHYERFVSYHSALYKHVEAISVTPFSSRALDRGLRGVFAAMNRIIGPGMAAEEDAQRFDPMSTTSSGVIEAICRRAEQLVGHENAELVRARLLSYADDWAGLTEELLRYTWLSDSEKPPENSRVLLHTAGTSNKGEWSVPGSLREVEPTAAFFLADGGTGA